MSKAWGATRLETHVMAYQGTRRGLPELTAEQLPAALKATLLVLQPLRMTILDLHAPERPPVQYLTISAPEEPPG